MLVQDYSNSIANALELLQSCTKSSIWFQYESLFMACQTIFDGDHKWHVRILKTLLVISAAMNNTRIYWSCLFNKHYPSYKEDGIFKTDVCVHIHKVYVIRVVISNIKVSGVVSRKYEDCPDSKVHGANMVPTWVLSAPDGPHVGPMNLAIRVGQCHGCWCIVLTNHQLPWHWQSIQCVSNIYGTSFLRNDCQGMWFAFGYRQPKCILIYLCPDNNFDINQKAVYIFITWLVWLSL